MLSRRKNTAEVALSTVANLGFCEVRSAVFIFIFSRDNGKMISVRRINDCAIESPLEFIGRRVRRVVFKMEVNLFICILISIVGRTVVGLDAVKDLADGIVENWTNVFVKVASCK